MKDKATSEAGAETSAAAEETKGESQITGLALVTEVDEQYLSDLRPEDIPDECVSDVDMTALEHQGTLASEAARSNLLKAQADIEAEAEEANRKFI